MKGYPTSSGRRRRGPGTSADGVHAFGASSLGRRQRPTELRRVSKVGRDSRRTGAARGGGLRGPRCGGPGGRGPVFRELVTLDEQGAAVRRRAVRSEVSKNAAADRLVDALIDARLLVSGRFGDEPTLEVAHEAVFACWPRLTQSIRADSDFLRWRKRLESARSEWERTRRDSERSCGAPGWSRPRPGIRTRRSAHGGGNVFRSSERRPRRLRSGAHATRDSHPPLAPTRRPGADPYERQLRFGASARGGGGRAAPTFEARAALFRALQMHPHVRSFLRGLTAPRVIGARYARPSASLPSFRRVPGDVGMGRGKARRPLGYRHARASR